MTAALPKIPRMERELRDATTYTSACAALRMKPNSRIAANENVLNNEHVDLSNNYIGGSGFQAVTHILSRNERLISVNASDNGLSNEAVVFFARSVTEHPTLKIIDLSNNPLSLPAALALLDLVHKNKRIAEVKLGGTNVDEPVLRRIKRSLNLNKTHLAAQANQTGPSPFQKTKEEYEKKHAGRRSGIVEKRKLDEATAPELVGEWVRAHTVRGPPRRQDGWAVVNICISATPTDFVSEIALIHDKIIPELNEKFADRKVYFNALSMYNDLPPHHHAKLDASKRYAVVEDHLANITKSIPLFVQLVGDTIGLPEYHKGGADASDPYPSILRRELKEAGEACSIVMLRRSALQLQVPHPMMGAVSANPSIVYPDANTHLIKASIAEAQGKAHPLSSFDIHTETKKWELHKVYREDIGKKLAPQFVWSLSDAEFDKISPAGHVLIKNTDSFVEGLTTRLEAAIDAMYPAAEVYEDEHQETFTKQFLSSAAMRVVGKKNLLGKLDLYAVTPPSRNMTLVYAGAGCGATTAMGAFVNRCIAKNSYLLGYHFTRTSGLVSEPSDPRAMFLNLAAQLLPDKKVPSYIASEVDVEKVKDYFVATLAQAAANLPDGKAVVLVIDGIDDVEDMVTPNPSLRVSETGAEIWAPAPPQDTVNASPVKIPVKKTDVFDYIPICLARNVRLVATCKAFGQTHRVLEARGHDSCEPVAIGELGDNDIESILNKALQPVGISLTEEELAVIRTKDDCRVLDYLRATIDKLKSNVQAPGQYASRQTLLEEMPLTLTEVYNGRLDRLERHFGVARVATACGVLLVSRWGVTEMEFREILAKPDATRIATGRPVLCGEIFNRLLRQLDCVLEPYVTEKDDAHPLKRKPMNALDMVVRVSSRTFLEAARARYFTESGSLTRIHHLLAHFYQRLGGSEGHPLQSKAVKEFPFHAISGRMWDTVQESVICLDYISNAYRFGLGYQTVREFVRAYNAIEDAPDSEISSKAAVLMKVKEYVYFVRDHNVNLAQYPHMVRQIAITCAADTHLHNDAKVFFKNVEAVSHFLVMNRTKAKLHRDAVTSLQFAPSGLRFVSGSDDRAIKICNLKGETIILVNQSTSKVKMVRYSSTSRYIVAVSEDRTTFVLDASNGNLVSKFHGHHSHIRALSMSSRGRFVATGSEDRTMKIWDSETGKLLCSVNHSPFSHSTSAFGGVSTIVPHPFAEDQFFSVCDKKFIGWKLNDARDECTETLCMVGHNSLPIANAQIVAEGNFVIITAKDISETPANFTRAEHNIKVFSLNTGRCVAILSTGISKGGSGPTFSVVSPDEKFLASALFDGTLQIHRLQVRSYVPDGEEPITVTPERHLNAFRLHPVPKVTQLAFSFDSKFITACGNQRQIKVWPVSGAAAPLANSQEPPAGEEAPATTATDNIEDTAALAEFLMEQQCVSLDWSQNPSGDADGGEMVVGDVVGRVHCLKLVHTSDHQQ